MKYFAYGEKMFSPDLLALLPGAICCGVAKLMGYKLLFHCKGEADPSGKCNIIPSKDPSSVVYGVLYNITEQERCLLDQREGIGRRAEIIDVRVFSWPSEKTEGEFAFTYIAHKDNIFEDLVPYQWYKDRVIEGAKRHCLPEEYIYSLQQIAAMLDPNIQRATKEKRYLEVLTQ